MKKKQQLRAEALASADAIRKEAEARGEDLTADELSSIKQHLDQARTLKAQIESQEAINASFDELDGELAGLEKALPKKTSSATSRVEVVKANFVDDPKKGFSSPRDFLWNMMEFSKNGTCAKVDNLRYMAAAGSDENSTSSDPRGGFLVPEGFSPQLLKIDPEMDFTAGRTTMIPMSTQTVKIPARVDKDHSSSVSGGLTVSRKAETVAGTSSRMLLEQIALQASTLFGLAYATEELLTDSPISFAAILSAGFSEEFTSTVLDEKINGTGVGQYLGIKNSPAMIEVAKEGGQAADTIVWENIKKMRSRVWGYNNAIWLASHDSIPQLMGLNQLVGTTGGVPVYVTSSVPDIPDSLLGRPIVYTEYVSKVGDAGDIICANFAEYLEGILQPLQSAESIHVRFIEHERAFKFWLRNAGTPWWTSALTPKNGGTSLSPFVQLAARA